MFFFICWIFYPFLISLLKIATTVWKWNGSWQCRWINAIVPVSLFDYCLTFVDIFFINVEMQQGNQKITDLIMGLCRSLEINMLFHKGEEGSNGFYTCRCFYFFLPNNTPNANSSKCLLLNQVQRPKIGEGLRSQYFGGDCARVDNHKTFSLQIQTLCETFRLIKDVIVLLLASLPLYI